MKKIKIKTGVKAGFITRNHNKTKAKARTGKKAGA